MTDAAVVSMLRRYREEAGWSQRALAERIRVSRQALIAIEAGRQVPSTALALQLARVLGCTVENLFQLSPTSGIEVTLAPDSETERRRQRQGAPKSTRAVIARIEGRWVAHRLPADSHAAADGVVVQEGPGGTQGSVRPLSDVAQLERNVLVAGCAPLLAILAHRAAARFRDMHVTWVPANSHRALDLLGAGLVHIAGVHLHDPNTAQDNISAVRERFGPRRMLVVNLTRWQQGLLVAAGNPLAIRKPIDLLRPHLRLARREEGAGAAQLLQRVLTSASAAPEFIPSGPMAASHAAVAQLVCCGAADAGVAIESVARAAGQGFLPLAEERFDLVMPQEWAASGPGARLIEMLGEPSYRAEAEQLPGYDGSSCGEVVALDEQ